MAQITITAAAQHGFKSRAQINKDVRSGKLPSTLERGRKVVDVADLVRLYGEPGVDPVLPGPEQAATEHDLETAQAAQARLETELREARDAPGGQGCRRCKGTRPPHGHGRAVQRFAGRPAKGS